MWRICCFLACGIDLLVRSHMLPFVHGSTLPPKLLDLALDSFPKFRQSGETFHCLPLVEDGGTVRFVRLVVISREVWMAKRLRHCDTLGRIEGEEPFQEIDG